MGLFDLFSKKQSDDDGEQKSSSPKKKSPREMARLAKLVGNKMTQNYDRQEALEELAKMGTGESAATLLTRFSWTMEPSITDQEEKEVAVRGIAAAGTDALEPIRVFCKKAESLTWPLRALKQIVDDESFVDELLTVLDQFDTEYVRNPEPKIQLIHMLEEFPSDDVRVAIEPFLEDANEPVRFHAVTSVFAMGSEESVAALTAALTDEESLRVKNRIASGLVERGWLVPDELVEDCTGALPPGFSVDEGKVVGSAATVG